MLWEQDPWKHLDCTYSSTNIGDYLQVFGLSTDTKWQSECKSHLTIAYAKRVRHSKKTVAAILLPLIFISPLIMQPIHSTHNGPPVWMNATVLFTTQLPFREGKKKNKEVKNASSTPVCVSAPVSEVTLQDFFTLSRCVCSAMSLSPSLSPCVCLPLVWSTELDSSFPSDWLTARLCLCLDHLWGKVAAGETLPCENSRWQTVETWACLAAREPAGSRLKSESQTMALCLNPFDSLI